MKFKAMTTRIPVADPDLQIRRGGRPPRAPPLHPPLYTLRTENGDFFLRSPKTYLSKMHSRLEIFKNAGFPLRCRLAFSVFLWTGEKIDFVLCFSKISGYMWKEPKCETRLDPRIYQLCMPRPLINYLFHSFSDLWVDSRQRLLQCTDRHVEFFLQLVASVGQFITLGLPGYKVIERAK